MIQGDIKTIKELDKILAENHQLIKDTSKSGSRAYTKIYSVKGNPLFKRIRVFFDERDKKGTIKVQDYMGLWIGVCTFTLIQVGMLIEESVTNLIATL